MMGASRRDLEALGGEGAGWRAVVESFRERYGKGASRAIADQFGVTMRTAQRALAGKTRTPKFTQTPAFADAARRKAAADRLRRTSFVDAGHVHVNYDQEDEGARLIGVIELDADALDSIAGMIEEGNWDEASDAFDKEVLNEYGGLGDDLTIDSYDDGLFFGE